MSDPTPHHDRIRELLAERALFGLSEEEMGELHSLPGGQPDDFDDLALAAAALDIAHHQTAGRTTPLPEDLRQRTLEAVRRAASEPQRKPVVAVGPLASPASMQPRTDASRGVRGREMLAWFCTAAALLIAAFLFSQQPTLDEPSPQELRAELLELRERDDPSVVQVAWTPSETDPAAKGAKGEILWSNKLNQGVMVFRGFAPNDPKENQYQLWIFDAERSADHPVDGGVFDVPAGSEEVVIPIDPRVPVSKATLFAVSVEKPGGVVVSDRSRLPLVAPVEEAKK
jgi:hypothetical protein